MPRLCWTLIAILALGLAVFICPGQARAGMTYYFTENNINTNWTNVQWGTVHVELSADKKTATIELKNNTQNLPSGITSVLYQSFGFNYKESGSLNVTVSSALTASNVNV